jgi:threonine dehydrogenase-like Zn-dependent dehydrogenase
LHATSAAPAVRLAGDALRGGRVAVLGCGPIGLSVVLAARKAGASEVCAVEPLAYRQNMARHLGASWAGAPAAAGQLAVGVSGGFDAVFECCPLAPTGRQPLSG